MVEKNTGKHQLGDHPKAVLPVNVSEDACRKALFVMGGEKAGKKGKRYAKYCITE